MTRRWLFADQLGPHFAPGRDGVLLVESRAALGRRRYHRQKLHLVLSALTRAGRSYLGGPSEATARATVARPIPKSRAT